MYHANKPGLACGRMRDCGGEPRGVSGPSDAFSVAILDQPTLKPIREPCPEGRADSPAYS